MSAICGIIHFDGSPIDREDLEAMASAAPFRGPDGCRLHLDQNAGLVHQAFHLTPESVNEKQPLISDDGRLALVADVRLDNREELAAKLALQSGSLPTMTDPELLLRAYQRWNTRCVEHLLGDFVMAVWNAQTKTLFLARDPLGGHGLTYHRHQQVFIFASETAAILDHRQVVPAVNEDAVVKTLAGIDLRPEETHFQAVHFLPPAHCMEISARGAKRWKYWDIDPDLHIVYQSEDQYTDHFLELLEQAVAQRLRSIGKTGISLSGGYDSTLLAAVAARRLQGSGDRLKSFSYVFERFSACDERRTIEPVVRQYDIDPTYVNADAMWTFADFSTHSIPRDFLWTNCYAQLPNAIAAAAQRAGCRLLLDGMFGDALFCEPGLFAADLIRQGRLGTLFSLFRAYPEAMSWRRDLLQHGLRPVLSGSMPDWVRRAYRHMRPAVPQGAAPALTERWQRRLGELASQQRKSAVHGRLSPGKGRAINEYSSPDGPRVSPCLAVRRTIAMESNGSAPISTGGWLNMSWRYPPSN